MLFFNNNLKRYQSTKRRLMDFHSELFSRADKRQITSCAKAIRLFKKKTIEFPSTNCVDMFTDFFIYSWPAKNNCLVSRADATNNQDLLEGMRNNVFSVFLVKPHSNDKINCTDLFRIGLKENVYDYYMAKTIEEPFLFATRLIKFPDFCCFSGSGFPVFSEALLEDIMAGTGTLLRTTKNTSVSQLSPEQETSFESLLISLCIKHKAYEQFRTEEI